MSWPIALVMGLAMSDTYLYLLMALLPLAAIAVVVQGNPYQALIIRGIFGAIAALVYAVFGAADVALTEALVGTMLMMTLCAIAVRSSMVMRLGVLQSPQDESDRLWQQFLIDLRRIIQRYHLRLELVPYTERTDLEQALSTKEIHAIRTVNATSEVPEGAKLLHIVTRIQRLYTLLQNEFSSSPNPTVITSLAYINLPENLRENVPKNLKEPLS
jgi:putative multicomponent Na+:H+ antiporter subunit B